MNQFQRRPFLAWPGWPHVRAAWLLTLLVAVWFGMIYIGADRFTAHRSLRVRIHLNAELGIPLIPAFTVAYMSLYGLFIAVPFVLRTRREITTLALAQVLTISVAGIGFLLIPGQLAYAPATDSELAWWKPLFVFADKLNLDYDLVPSLHVALAIVCVESFVAHTDFSGKIFWRTWGILIAASTLLTHQHHLLDVITGYLLALVIVRLTRHLANQE